MLKLTLVTITLACTAGAGSAVAQDAVASFKASVDVVPISAVVRDARGRTITTLQAGEFEVRDHGLGPPILAVHSDDHALLIIAILFDTSGSMRLGSKIAAAREVVARLAA